MDKQTYNKGRKKEYKVMKQERELGNIVLRSAGSHSPIDIVSIDVEMRVIKLIQCKSDNITEADRTRIELPMKALNNMFRCEFKVV